VERANPQPFHAFTQQMLHPVFHFPGGLVGEGDGHNIEQAHAHGLGEVGDPVGEHPGLARSRSGQHQGLAQSGGDGGFLLGVEG